MEVLSRKLIASLRGSHSHCKFIFTCKLAIQEIEVNETRDGKKATKGMQTLVNMGINYQY